MTEDYELPLPDGAIVCGGNPTNDDVVEIYRFNEYLVELATRGKKAVHNDPKWRKYLGLPEIEGD